MWIDATVGWLLFGSLLLAIGAISGRWVLLTRTAILEPLMRETLRISAARIGLAATAAFIVAISLVFARQVLEIRDVFVPLRDDLRMLAGTSWGSNGIIALAVSALALGGFRAAVRGNRVGWWVATLAVLALSAYPAQIGHASGQESWRTLAIIADATHVLSAGAWIGGLTVLVFLSRPHHEAAQLESGSGLVEALVPAFSRLAKLAVAGLVISGSFAAWRILPGTSALWWSSYGRLFVLKVTLFLGVLALGARNHRSLASHRGTATGTRAMTRSMMLELAVANAVLVVTALLVRGSPDPH